MGLYEVMNSAASSLRGRGASSVIVQYANDNFGQLVYSVSPMVRDYIRVVVQNRGYDWVLIVDACTRSELNGQPKATKRVLEKAIKPETARKYVFNHKFEGWVSKWLLKSYDRSVMLCKSMALLN